MNAGLAAIVAQGNAQEDELAADELAATALATAVAGKEPAGLSAATQASLAATYLTYDGTSILKNGSPVPIAGGGSGAIVITSLGGTADQSARINTALAAGSAFGTKRLVALVGDFTITSPLIVYSNTILDLSNAILNVPTGVQINAIQNAAYKVTGRGVTDGQISSGTTTLTSATAAFVSGDVGKPISVQGVGTAGTALVTTIAAVNSATSVTLAAPSVQAMPFASVYVAIGPRDSNITVRGGRVDRNATYGADDNSRHALVFHRLDGLTVENTTIKVTNGKYAVLAADVTNVRGRNINFDGTASDGFHVNGPARQVTLENFTGQTGDDFVAFLVAEGSVTAGYWSTQGDLDQISVRNIVGASNTCMVKIQGDSTYGVGVGTIEVDGVTVNTTIAGYNSRAVHLSSGSGVAGYFRSVSLKNLYGFVTVFGGTTAGGTVDELSVENLTCPPLSASTGGVNLFNAAVVHSLRIRGARSRQTGSQTSLLRLNNTATVDTAVIEAADWGGGSSACTAQLASATAVLTTLILSDVVLENSTATGSVIGTTVGCTLTRVSLTNVDVRQASNIASFNSTTDVTVHGVRTAGTGFNVNAGYTMTIRGSGFNIGGTNNSGGTTYSYTPEYKLALSLGSTVGVALGTMLYNTATYNGVVAGPVVSDGTKWLSMLPASGMAISDVQAFTTSGTWTMPAGANEVNVVCIGGGAGGGSGMRGANGGIRGGGAGGGGAGITRVVLPASAVTSTVTCTVGTGGPGGAALTIDGTGAAGTAGGPTAFGSLVRANGGGGGAGGTSTGSTAGTAGVGAVSGTTGGAGASAGTAGAGASGTSSGPAGGGAGGGITAANVASGGGVGGSSISAVNAAAAGGVVDSTAAGVGSARPVNSALPGSGGGGGASSVTTNAQNGGDAGIYGAGGGGGGASVTGFNSGAGGAGSGGIILVITN